MSDSYTIRRLTQCPWLNLFEIRYEHRGRHGTWMTCSRKARPVAEADRPDAVIIVPVHVSAAGRRLVVIREFRVPIWGYEYSFPAGLIDPGDTVEHTIRKELKEETGLDLTAIRCLSRPVFSSAGFTDESCHMALVEVTGTPSDDYLESQEDISVHLLDVAAVRALLASTEPIAAKAWGLLYHVAVVGEIALEAPPS